MGPIINSLGGPVAENVVDLLSTATYDTDGGSVEANPLSSPIKADEFGEIQGGLYIWTGSNAYGAKDTTDPAELCSDWTSADAGKKGRAGLVISRMEFWIDASSLASTQDACHNLNRLYCIQK